MTEIESLAFANLKQRIAELEENLAFLEARMVKSTNYYEDREKEILKAYKSLTGETNSL